MTKMFFPLLMVLSLATISCKKESQDAAQLNGSWKVKTLKSKEVSRFAATCVFDVAALTISGSSGCNQYGASIIIDEKNQDLSIGSITQTKIGCAGELGTFETDFFNVLKEVQHYKFKSKTAVEISTHSGSKIELVK
jgi:heat shock protein HslJ